MGATTFLAPGIPASGWLYFGVRVVADPQLGYLSCRQASSFVTLGWVQMRQSDTLLREVVA
jgi:hypothetical protein